MALIDVVSFENNNQEFVRKFPSTNLRWGSQLVVKPGQTAFFVYRGTVRQEVSEGTVTLDTLNFPFLTTLTSVPFGGDTPFQAEVWFVNLVAKLDNLWGTRRPLQLEDPKYGVVVPVRAYGQFGFRIVDARKFFETLVGAGAGFSADQVVEYFTGVVLQAVNVQLARALVALRVSVLEAPQHLEAIAAQCALTIDEEFAKFGANVVNFYFHSVNVPEEDPSFRRLKQLKEKSAELQMLGRDIYQYDRSMEVLRTAAANEGAVGLQTGMGLGMGLGLGQSMAGQFSSLTTQLPPELPRTQYYFSIDGERAGPFELADVAGLVENGKLSEGTLGWHAGLSDWLPLQEMPTIAALLKPVIANGGAPPPLP